MFGTQCILLVSLISVHLIKADGDARVEDMDYEIAAAQRREEEEEEQAYAKLVGRIGEENADALGALQGRYSDLDVALRRRDVELVKLLKAYAAHTGIRVTAETLKLHLTAVAAASSRIADLQKEIDEGIREVEYEIWPEVGNHANPVERAKQEAGWQIQELNQSVAKLEAELNYFSSLLLFD